MSIEHAPTTANNKLYSIDGTAEILGCGRTSIYALLKNGNLEAIKIGKLTRITSQEIERFISAAEKY